MDPPYAIGNLPIGWVTPLIHEGKIYMGSLEGALYVMNLYDGRVLRKIEEGSAIQGKPLISGDLIIYGTLDGQLIARNVTTFKEVYRRDLGASIESEAVVYKNRLFVHLRNHTLAAFDYKTGKILWSYKRAVPYLTTLNRVSIPLGYKENVIVGFADGFLASISIHEGKVTWETKIADAKKFVDIDLTPVLINGRVWIGSLGASVHVINADNGDVLRKTIFRTASEPMVIGKNIYVLTDKGMLIVLDDIGAVKKEVKVFNEGFSSARAWKDKIIASTFRGKLVAIDLDTFETSDVFNFGYAYSSLFGYLENNDEYFAAYSSRNRLYVFR